MDTGAGAGAGAGAGTGAGAGVDLAVWRELQPAIDVDGPRVRMGALWAAVSLGAAVLGPLPLAIVFAGVALGAAGQSCMAWRRFGRARGDISPPTRPKARQGRPRLAFPPVAIGGAVLLALAGASGPEAVGAAAVLVGVAAFVVSRTTLGGKRYDGVLTAAVAMTVGIAAAVVPVVRAEFGFSAAMVLLSSVHVYEASAFVIGAGARHRWEGAIAGAASVVAISLAAAAVLVPPFRGASAWILGGLVIALTGVGRRAASALLPNADAFAPALRRIDGFLVTGPVWAVVAALVLDVRYG